MPGFQIVIWFAPAVWVHVGVKSLNPQKSTFSQYTTQSFRPNASTLDFFLNTKEVNFFTLSEIFLSFKNISDLKLSNNKSVFKYRSDGCGGVAIFIKKCINLIQIP